jgi:hypothetical protein
MARFLPPDLNAPVAKKRKKTILNNLIQENRNREQLTILSEKFTILEYCSERDGYIFNSHDHYSEVLKRLFKYMKNNWRETAPGKRPWNVREKDSFSNCMEYLVHLFMISILKNRAASTYRKNHSWNLPGQNQ